MVEGIRLLTLWQNWASLIALNLKRFETRSWPTKYRGSLAIHAARRPVCLVKIPRSLLTQQQFDLLRSLESVPLGGIVAVVRLVSCREMWDSEVYGPLMSPSRRGIDIATVSPLEKAVGDWQEGRFAWELADIRPILPVWCKGGQGLRKVSPELLRQVEDRLNETAAIEQLLGGQADA